MTDPGLIPVDPVPIPTVRPQESFDPASDAAALRKAMKGFGSDEKAIINVLAYRTSDERQKIIASFQQCYGKDLVKELKDELGGSFERIVLAMMKPTNVLLAEDLHHAMQGIGTNEDTLCEILCTRTNQEMAELKATYKKLYDKELSEEMAGETSGHFRRLLISMSTGARDESNDKIHLAPQLAQELYDAGAGQSGTDESEFNRILSCYSPAVTRAILDEYQNIKGKSLVDTIDSEFSGDIKSGLMDVVESMDNRPRFFAMCLNNSLAGMGTRDRDLIRLVVTRSEVDLGTIMDEYEEDFGKSLIDHIKGDCSGDYKKMLVALCDQ